PGDRVGTQVGKDGLSAFSGEVQVEKKNVGWSGLQPLLGLFGRSGRLDLVAPGPEESHEQAAHLGIVVDDQHGSRRCVEERQMVDAAHGTRGSLLFDTIVSSEPQILVQAWTRAEGGAAPQRASFAPAS